MFHGWKWCLGVRTINPKHNHELTLPSKRDLLRYGHHISKPKTHIIDSMVNASTSTKNAYLHLTKEVGRSEIVGFTQRDCYNHANVQKMTMICVGEV